MQSAHQVRGSRGAVRRHMRFACWRSCMTHGSRPGEKATRNGSTSNGRKATRGLDYLEAKLPRSHQGPHGGQLALAPLNRISLALRFPGQVGTRRPKLKRLEAQNSPRISRNLKRCAPGLERATPKTGRLRHVPSLRPLSPWAASATVCGETRVPARDARLCSHHRIFGFARSAAVALSGRFCSISASSIEALNTARRRKNHRHASP